MLGEKHKRIFERWRRRLPSNRRLLIDTVVERLVPVLESQGFAWVNSIHHGDAGEVDRCDQIPMRREAEGYYDFINIGFKKNRITFSVSFRRWTNEEASHNGGWFPHFLTRWNSEGWRAKEFGFSSFDPFVNQVRCNKVVNKVISLLPQMDECFETGRVGKNVTESVRVI